MQRYIDAEKLKHILNNSKYYGTEDGDAFADMIADCDTENVAPVRHGKWVSKWVRDVAMFRCSECGAWDGYRWHRYCYNCGAKMDEVKEDGKQFD